MGSIHLGNFSVTSTRGTTAGALNACPRGSLALWQILQKKTLGW
ncbi:MAG: hypothetical protein U5K99_00555 [Anaerolineales bacterium]|nr:hypothetical protein [Anaerolineales bacterium]